jgi:hypothetical protein
MTPPQNAGLPTHARPQPRVEPPSSTRHELLLALLSCAVGVAFAAPVLHEIGNWGVLDWDFQLHHHAVPRLAIVEHHQIPLWNPYNWSGLPMLGHPESRVLAPTFALSLLFGEVIGLKLELVLHLLIGLLGMQSLMKHLGAGPIARFTASAVFMLNSSYALHVSVGHVWAFSFAYFPWALLFHLKALTDLRYSLGLSLVVVLTLMAGAPYQFMMLLTLVALHSGCSVLLDRRELRRHARVLAAVFLQVFLIGAVKLLPTIELMSAHPRLTDADSGYTPAALMNALFDRHQTLAAAFAERPGEFNGTPLHEGMYIGWLPLLPFLAGLASHWRRQRALLATLLLFAWLSLGSQTPVSLWEALHRLPVFDNMRMAQRFGLVVTLGVAVFVGLGAQRLREALERRTSRPSIARACATAFALLLLADLTLVASPILRDAFTIAPLTVERSPRFEQILRRPIYGAPEREQAGAPFHGRTLSGLYPATLSNRGSVRGYRIIPSASPAIPLGSPRYRGEVHLEAGAGRVTTVTWSPNRLRFQVEAPQGGLLVVNQRHAPGWRARTEGQHARNVTEVRGLLAVELLPGDHSLELRYRPVSFAVGAAVSACALPILTGLVLRTSDRRRRRGGTSRG